MLVYIIIALILIFAVYKERQALGCPNIPNGRDCDNAHGKAVDGTEPLPSDPLHVLLSKISRASAFMNRWVTWRLAIIASFICTTVVWFFVFQSFPSEFQLSISMFVISAVVYFTLNFYKFHLGDYIQDNVSKSVSLVKKTCHG